MRLHSASGVETLRVRFLALFSTVILSLWVSACGDNGVVTRDATVDSNAAGSAGSGGMAMGGMFGRGGTGGNGGAGGGMGGAIGAGGNGGTDGTDGGADDSATDGPIDAGSGNGAACSGGSECASGNCVDSICCDSACALTCYTCASANFPGVCVPADRGTDPHNECEDKGATLCQTNGACDGTGSCLLYPAGTV